MEVESIPQIENVLDRFPSLKIVLDSAGHPDLEGGPPYPKAEPVFALSRHENVYLKVTAATFESYADVPVGGARFMRTLVDRFGPDRIVWGTNFPASTGSVRKLLELAEHNFEQLSENEREKIFFETAYRIYLISTFN